MHTRGDWKVTRLAEQVSIKSGDEFLAMFDGVYVDPGPTAEENAVRACLCVNALDGVENPDLAVRTWRADARYLAKYRDAYCAAVERELRLSTLVTSLQAEVRERRRLVSAGLDGSDLLNIAEHLVDESHALDPIPEGPLDISRYKGLDVLAVQQLLGAVWKLLDSADPAPPGPMRQTRVFVSDLTAVRVEVEAMRNPKSGSGQPG